MAVVHAAKYNRHVGRASAASFEVSKPKSVELETIAIIREHLFHKRAPADPMFRWRGGDVSRVEALSDAVFAFALALLFISQDAPKSVYDLWLIFRQFPAFAATFALLLMIWYYHYKFFRRYGLEDLPTIFLNTLLLFLVLFYVFPLKFLFSQLWNGLVIRDPAIAQNAFPEMTGLGEYVRNHPMQFATFVYSAGVVAIFGTFALMNWYAWTRREKLELDELEQFLTKAAIRTDLISAGVGLASCLIVVLGGLPQYAGMVYFVMPIAHGLNGYWNGSNAEKIQKRLEASG